MVHVCDLIRRCSGNSECVVQVAGHASLSPFLSLSSAIWVLLPLNSSGLAGRICEQRQPALWLGEDVKWQLETGLGTTAFIFVCNIICASSPSFSPSVLNRALREGREKRKGWLTLVHLGFSSAASVALADRAPVSARCHKAAICILRTA